MSNRWHYRINGRDVGPVDFATLHQMASEERLFLDDEIRPEDSEEWVRAQTVPGLFAESADEGDLDSMLSGEFAATAPQVRTIGSDACYCRIRAEELGPIPFDKLVGLARTGRLGRRDQVRIGVHAQWVEARSVAGLFDESKKAAPVPTPSVAAPPADSASESLDDFQLVVDPTPRKPRPPREEIVPAVRMEDDDVRPVPAPSVNPARPAAGSGELPIPNTLAQWHCRLLGQEVGPIGWSDLRELVESRQLGPNDRVRKERSGAWVPAATIDELFPKRAKPAKKKKKQTVSEDEVFDYLQADEPEAEDEVGSHVAPQRSFSPSSPPAGPAPVAIERPSASGGTRPARTESGTPAPAPRAATPSPPTRGTPAPARTAPKEKRPMRNPLSGLGSGLAGMAGSAGGGLSKLGKPLALVAAVVLVGAGIYSVMPAFSGESTQGAYTDTVRIWKKAEDLKTADKKRWSSFANLALEQSMAIQSQLNQIPKKRLKGDRMAELMLECHRDYLPKILAGTPKDHETEWSAMEKNMSEAQKLAGG